MTFLGYADEIIKWYKKKFISVYVSLDNSCLFFQHKDVKTIEVQLSRDFSTLIFWFVDNKLSLKSIPFSSKHRSKTIDQLDISYKDVKVRQYSEVCDVF